MASARLRGICEIVLWRECGEMASRYSEIASGLQGEIPEKARDKNLADGEKIKMLLKSKKAEES